MKKFFSLVLLFIGLISILSCDDQLNPYGEMKEKYVLNCIIRADSSFQIAMLTKSYQTGDFDPYSNTNDPSIKGAKIRIWNKDNVVILRDTTIARTESDKYQTPYTVFYSKSFQPLPNTPIEIEALLPNGKRLVSQSQIPADITFNELQSDTIIPPKDKNFIRVRWFSDQKNAVFITRLGIYYFKHEGGEKKRYIQVIPLNYVKFGDELIPNYPKPNSELALVADNITINQAMELISKGDPDKGKYEILSCILEVLSLDQNLSTYYNSTARSRDAYSVKLDETDYSNVTGGYGVFGVYNRNYYVIRFTHAYIRSFGYFPGLTE